MTQDGTPTAQPPHDLEAEKTVLRAMLRSTEAIADVVELLHYDDFYRHAHGRIYQAVLEVYARDEDPDPRSVADQLAKHEELADVGGDVYLQRLAGEPAARDSWVTAASTVQGMAVLRRMMVAAAGIDDLTADVTADTVDRLIDTAEAEIFAATSRSRSRIPQSHPLADVLESALDEIEAIGSHPGETAGIPTGFRDLDALTGGLYPGQLIVIAGRPTAGTSTLTLNLLRSAAIKHNLPAALFALESRRTDITLRLLAAEARVALHHMRSGSMTDDDWTRLAKRMPEVSGAPLYLQDDPYATFTELRAHCRRLHRQHGLQLIAVDDVQLLNYSNRPLGSRYQEVSEIARSLKHLAKELQIPVIAVSTLNRGPEQRTDKLPVLSDLRDSGALEDNADLVILIHREDMYEKESPRAGEAELIVAKHRYGPTATLTVAHQGHYGRFVDMALT
ncbi:replicative DNA helicase [Streptomyces agglomeratus]|uniref:replicative DNA helicase n=1 Tax=Streptomyces agglomeratus TaxID=285458 RepID=UPI0008544643|nr:replicative DNA helicase [Streptomyces agglomeratus]OEJ36314.1 replicative DNA helicase [Streptomyces agglomeratus]